MGNNDFVGISGRCGGGGDGGGNGGGAEGSIGGGVGGSPGNGWQLVSHFLSASATKDSGCQ